MKILAVDTSTRHLSLAVSEGDKILASRNVHPQKDLSLTITFHIEHVLQKANVFLHDISGFAIGLGPGSFTSLRVGLSMMKAFIMVTEKPVVGISSLDVLAMNVKIQRPVQICTITDARRNLLYGCLYEKKHSGLTRKCDYLLQPIDEILKVLEGEVVFVGDGIDLTRDVILDRSRAKGAKFTPIFEKEKHWLPQARELARLGYQRLLKGDFDKIETLVPLYLYPEDCQVQHKSQGHNVTKSQGHA